MYRFIVADARLWVQQALTTLIQSIYPTAQVHNVGSAPALARENGCYPADLILMDYHLPGLAIDHMRDVLPSAGDHIPIIIFTANPADVIAAEQHGATRAIDNPFDLPTLRTVLADALPLPQFAHVEG